VVPSRVKVRAGDKGLSAGTRENDAANVFVLLKCEKSLPQLVERPRVERVQALGPLDRENGNTSLTFDEQVVKGHAGESGRRL
jgi:hypothetical protein